MTIMQKTKKNFIKFRRSLRNGAMETQDLTPVEQGIALHSTKVGAVGMFGCAAAKFAAGAVTAKVMFVGGAAICGAVFAKSFVRGFGDQWQSCNAKERLEAVG